MKSKAQVVNEEQAKRDVIDRQKQGESAMVIGGPSHHIKQTTFEKTQAWLSERSKQAAKNRMALASRYEPVAICEPIKLAPRLDPPKPAVIGDVVEDKGYVGNKVVQRIKRIVGV